MKLKRINNINLYISLIILAFLIISAFVPIVQILIMYLNGGVIYIVEKLFNSGINATLYIFNSTLSILFLISFLSSKKMVLKILFAIFFVIFSFAVFGALLEKPLRDTGYPIHLLLTGLVIGLIMSIASVIKPQYR